MLATNQTPRMFPVLQSFPGIDLVSCRNFPQERPIIGRKVKWSLIPGIQAQQVIRTCIPPKDRAAGLRWTSRISLCLFTTIKLADARGG